MAKLILNQVFAKKTKHRYLVQIFIMPNVKQSKIINTLCHNVFKNKGILTMIVLFHVFA